MTARGTSFDAGADACPFVALELDRDRRSERPDYRHRCYAEPTPAPRTIAHQERYCLSPNFSGCPIFQDWAVRAAARPVPLPQGQPRSGGADPRGMIAGAAAAGAGTAGGSALGAGTAGEASGDALVDEPGPNEPWPDSMSSMPAPPPAPPSTTGATPIDTATDAAPASGGAPPPTQLAAFDADEPSAILPPPLTVAGPADAPIPAVAPDRVIGAAPPGPAAEVPPPGVEPAASVPAFLVGRSTRSRSGPPIDEKIARDDVVPSWDIDGRFGALSGSGPDRPSTFSRLLTIIAVVVILGLGIAAVIIVPGLLSSQPRSTIRPSLATVPSPSRLPSPSSNAGVATIAPSAVATPDRPTDPPDPTGQPTPAASPVLYRIRSGDTLAKIARRNNITVQELLAANPQITNPDHVEVGQVIVLPPPSATPAP